ncbi:MAG: hypothetical protein GF308_00620 [Candidatus Heimdallarchaeota archaeon]|nr:hypothetical protein [Candidatus Heimdallarchaeota archaeon]
MGTVSQDKKMITLTGRLLTPVITPKPTYKHNGCWVRILSDLETEKKGRLAIVGKLVKGGRKAPTLLKGFRGFVKVSYVDESEERLRERIATFLGQGLGSKTKEGYGRVDWIDCQISDYQAQQPPKWKKLKIRKGLGPDYPKELQRLIIALLLHDFVHTNKHQSKIYEQVTIEDEEIREACVHHHNSIKDNDLLPLVQYYDGLASYIAQKKPYKSYSRYNTQDGKIDFKALAREIEKRQHSAYQLYQFVYQSKALTRLVKSMDYKGSLRNHLLLMVNLAINDYRQEKLIISNGNFQLLSSSATDV